MSSSDEWVLYVYILYPVCKRVSTRKVSKQICTNARLHKVMWRLKIMPRRHIYLLLNWRAPLPGKESRVLSTERENDLASSKTPPINWSEKSSWFSFLDGSAGSTDYPSFLFHAFNIYSLSPVTQLLLLQRS